MKKWETDVKALQDVISEFEYMLPGFWWSIGQCSVSAHASCSVDGNGVQKNLLVGTEQGDPLDSGFHCDTDSGSPSDALRAVMNLALTYLKENNLERVT